MSSSTHSGFGMPSFWNMPVRGATDAQGHRFVLAGMHELPMLTRYILDMSRSDSTMRLLSLGMLRRLLTSASEMLQQGLLVSTDATVGSRIDRVVDTWGSTSVANPLTTLPPHAEAALRQLAAAAESFELGPSGRAAAVKDAFTRKGMWLTLVEAIVVSVMATLVIVGVLPALAIIITAIVVVVLEGVYKLFVFASLESRDESLKACDEILEVVGAALSETRQHTTLIRPRSRQTDGTSEPRSPKVQSPIAPLPRDDDNIGELLLDVEEVLRRRSSIHALLEEVDNSEGEVRLRVRGHGNTLVRMSELSRHVLIAVVDMDGRVVFWSDGAVAISGFVRRDAEGKDVSHFLFGDAAVQSYKRLVDGARRNVPIGAKPLTLAHVLGQVTVIASVSIARDEKGMYGYTLIASRGEEALNSLGALHSYFSRELRAELESKSGDNDLSCRSVQLVERLSWTELCGLSAAARSWSVTQIQSILSDCVRDFLRYLHVPAADPVMLEHVLCDKDAIVRCVVSALTNMCGPTTGKLRLGIARGESRDTVQQIVVSLVPSSPPLNAVFAELRAKVRSAGGDVCAGERDRMTLRFPVFAAEGPRLPMSDSDTQNRKAALTMTILLLEPNAVYRHTISTVAWGLGHSLRVVDSVAKALRGIGDAGTEVHCAIVDCDVRGADGVVSALAAKGVPCIETTEAGIVDAGPLMLPKRLVQTKLEGLLEEVASMLLNRRREEQEQLKRRAIFARVRKSPWNRGRKLGRGAFADVYESISTMTGGKMAVKMIRSTPGAAFEQQVDELINEIEILSSLEHPNIIHYFYCERGETTVNLFMELALDGSLQDLLSQQGTISEERTGVLMRQLLLAVAYLHENGILHRDIKPGNILLSQGMVKLSDFGTATQRVSQDTTGTMLYMAPEVVDGTSVYGVECDIWSIGCVACECLRVRRPRREGSMGFGVPSEEELTRVSSVARDFILLCLCEDPSSRASASSLSLHSFVVDAPAVFPVDDASHAEPTWSVDDESAPPPDPDNASKSISSEASW